MRDVGSLLTDVGDGTLAVAPPGRYDGHALRWPGLTEHGGAEPRWLSAPARPA
ncbi:hypothetical protein [Prauserella flavalba]|uniref:hypothetical protein n=1 Tax=Prauserella flavalba TaxID=1477506 RepID=UPI00143D180A|nr:hypothetical protein [Prauserella flavalba]